MQKNQIKSSSYDASTQSYTFTPNDDANDPYFTTKTKFYHSGKHPNTKELATYTLSLSYTFTGQKIGGTEIQAYYGV